MEEKEKKKDDYRGDCNARIKRVTSKLFVKNPHRK